MRMMRAIDAHIDGEPGEDVPALSRAFLDTWYEFDETVEQREWMAWRLDRMSDGPSRQALATRLADAEERVARNRADNGTST